MCKTCNNTGGVNIEHSWGITFHPCPSSNCDFDREKAIKEQAELINQLQTEIYSRKNAS